MSITLYPCLYNGKELRNLAVIRGDKTENGNYVPISVYPKSSWRFSSSSAAEAASDYLFDSQATFLCYVDYKNNLNKKGITDVYTFNFGTSHTFILSDSRQIRMSYSGSYPQNSATYIITYIKNGKTLSVNDYQRYNSSIEPAIGLTSERVYHYEINGNHYKALLTPTLNHVGGSFGLGSPSDTVGGELANLFPSYLNYSSSSSSGSTSIFAMSCKDSDSSDVHERFEAAVEFLTDFWTGIKFQYAGITTISVGGSVTPTAFFSSVNEPRMFTVTPDSHHSIYSVVAYNTNTGARIPLQESAMDLLTGAKNYIFNMPSANVRIVIEFRQIEISIPVTVKYTDDLGKIHTTSFALTYDNSKIGEES